MINLTSQKNIFTFNKRNHRVKKCYCDQSWENTSCLEDYYFIKLNHDVKKDVLEHVFKKNNQVF